MLPVSSRSQLPLPVLSLLVCRPLFWLVKRRGTLGRRRTTWHAKPLLAPVLMMLDAPDRLEDDRPGPADLLQVPRLLVNDETKSRAAAPDRPLSIVARARRPAPWEFE